MKRKLQDFGRYTVLNQDCECPPGLGASAILRSLIAQLMVYVDPLKLQCELIESHGCGAPGEWSNLILLISEFCLSAGGRRNDRPV